MIPVRVQLASMACLDLTALPPNVAAELREMFTMPNPAYAKAERAGHWTGNIPRTLEGWSVVDGETLVLPRGGVGLALWKLKQLGFEWALEDRSHSGAELGPGWRYRAELRDYQTEALQAMRAKQQGYIVLPPGSGKTEIGDALVADVGRTSLIVVHTKDLAQQWQDRLHQRLGQEPGLIGGGQRKPAPVTVAMVQTLSKWSAQDLEDLGFGLVVLDECHHAPAATFLELLGRLPCRWRYGLTATPWRDDGLSKLIGWSFGRELYKRTAGELAAAGHLVKPRREKLETGFRWDGDPTTDYHGLLDELTADSARNALIVRRVVQALEDGDTVLVLSCRVAHCQELARLITEAGHRCEALTGSVPAKRRTAVLEQLRSGELRCATASQLADEGLDVPALSCVVLTAPARARGRTTQRIGRTMRPSPGKQQPVVVDVVDPLVGVLRSQARDRAAAHEEAMEVGRG